MTPAVLAQTQSVFFGASILLTCFFGFSRFSEEFVSSRLPAEYWDFSRVTSMLLPSFILTPGIWVSFVSFPSDNFSTWELAGGGLLALILGWSLLIPLFEVGVGCYIFRSLSFFFGFCGVWSALLSFYTCGMLFILSMAWCPWPAPSHLRSVALAQ